MTQLNSSFQTVLQRRCLPVIISLILLGVLAVMLAPPTSPAGVVVAATVVVGLVSLAYFSAYRLLVYRAADRVVLDGEVLRVTRSGQEATIPVGSVTAIHSMTGISPETITLDLAAESEVGRSITFIPPARFPSSHEHPVLAPLRAVMRSA